MGVKVKKYKGSWYVFIDYHGQRKSKKVGSREAAEKVKRGIEARLALGDFGILREKECTSFAEYSQRWLRLHVKPYCKLSTAMSYEQVLRLYLLPRFGALPLDEITRDKVKSYFSEISALGKFGHGTLKNILATIRALLNHAVEEGLVAANPALRLGRVALRGARKRTAEFLIRQRMPSAS